MARLARPRMAAAGSISTPTSSASGQRRPAASRNRADPQPGSTTRAGRHPLAAAHAIMLSMTGAGVKVWPRPRRRAGPRSAQNAAPSGSPPARTCSRTAARPAASAGDPGRPAAASRCSARDQPGTLAAPSRAAAASQARLVHGAAAGQRRYWQASGGIRTTGWHRITST